MRQMTAVLAVTAAYVFLVGSRFTAADGEKLAAVGRVVAGKVRAALPPEITNNPVGALRKGLPERVEDRVAARLAADKRLQGIDFAVTADGGAVALRGVVPDAAARRKAVALAENTVGVERVVDELAVPE
ncbi:MAG: BON domain-containing protein [Gemmataceae bacterium]|nr:BON domain-containing protein [Gemmataceae bacterium]